ncbi:DUF5776 domain-containing protein [Acetilactobacillus jinshanensis]|uniref:DUF5776 domain-containing protein n=1 Tax=Acetilactobacillus jinshanensis TaxID=1720083 RepID=A0A4P6ZL24_9LACO|nr:DUF5776 domain-containing protein [Acetilactobacillus jinshanensis]QBP18486.1 hypothetical protein ELX58_04910 [Acetilactobacillus jinshanensis]
MILIMLLVLLVVNNPVPLATKKYLQNSANYNEFIPAGYTLDVSNLSTPLPTVGKVPTYYTNKTQNVYVVVNPIVHTAMVKYWYYDVDSQGKLKPKLLKSDSVNLDQLKSELQKNAVTHVNKSDGTTYTTYQRYEFPVHNADGTTTEWLLPAGGGSDDSANDYPSDVSDAASPTGKTPNPYQPNSVGGVFPDIENIETEENNHFTPGSKNGTPTTPTLNIYGEKLGTVNFEFVTPSQNGGSDVVLTPTIPSDINRSDLSVNPKTGIISSTGVIGTSHALDGNAYDIDGTLTPFMPKNYATSDIFYNSHHYALDHYITNRSDVTFDKNDTDSSQPADSTFDYTEHPQLVKVQVTNLDHYRSTIFVKVMDGKNNIATYDPQNQWDQKFDIAPYMADVLASPDYTYDNTEYVEPSGKKVTYGNNNMYFTNSNQTIVINVHHNPYNGTIKLMHNGQQVGSDFTFNGLSGDSDTPETVQIPSDYKVAKGSSAHVVLNVSNPTQVVNLTKLYTGTIKLVDSATHKQVGSDQVFPDLPSDRTTTEPVTLPSGYQLAPTNPGLTAPNTALINFTAKTTSPVVVNVVKNSSSSTTTPTTYPAKIVFMDNGTQVGSDNYGELSSKYSSTRLVTPPSGYTLANSSDSIINFSVNKKTIPVDVNQITNYTGIIKLIDNAGNQVGSDQTFTNLPVGNLYEGRKSGKETTTAETAQLPSDYQLASPSTTALVKFDFDQSTAVVHVAPKSKSSTSTTPSTYTGTVDFMDNGTQVGTQSISGLSGNVSKPASALTLPSGDDLVDPAAIVSFTPNNAMATVNVYNQSEATDATSYTGIIKLINNNTGAQVGSDQVFPNLSTNDNMTEMASIPSDYQLTPGFNASVTFNSKQGGTDTQEVKVVPLRTTITVYYEDSMNGFPIYPAGFHQGYKGQKFNLQLFLNGIPSDYYTTPVDTIWTPNNKPVSDFDEQNHTVYVKFQMRKGTINIIYVNANDPSNVISRTSVIAPVSTFTPDGTGRYPTPFDVTKYESGSDLPSGYEFAGKVINNTYQFNKGTQTVDVYVKAVPQPAPYVPAPTTPATPAPQTHTTKPVAQGTETNLGDPVQYNAGTRSDPDMVTYKGKQYPVHYANGMSTITVKVRVPVRNKRGKVVKRHGKPVYRYKSKIVSTSLPVPHTMTPNTIRAVDQIDFDKPAKHVWTSRGLDNALKAAAPGEIVSYYGHKFARVSVPNHFRYFWITKDTLAHLHMTNIGNTRKFVQALKSHHLLTIFINRIYVAHTKKANYVRYEIKLNHHYYMVTARDDYVPNAYWQKSDFNAKRAHAVRVTHECEMYTSQRYGKKTLIKPIHVGTVLHVKKVIFIGKHGKSFEQTRLLLTNGKYVTANKNFVQIMK